MYQSFCEKSRKNFTFFVLCLAWQNLILPLVRLALGHNYCLSNLNFHIYNIAHKPRKVKKNFQLFSCTILLRLCCEVGTESVLIITQLIDIQGVAQKRQGGFALSH